MQLIDNYSETFLKSPKPKKFSINSFFCSKYFHYFNLYLLLLYQYTPEEKNGK